MMTLTVETRALKAAATYMNAVRQKRNTIPILSQVHVAPAVASKGRAAVLTVTDLDMAAAIMVPSSTIIAAAAFMLPDPGALAHALACGGSEATLDVVRTISDVKVNASAGPLALTINPRTFADDFPITAVRLSSETLKASIGQDFMVQLKRVTPAMSSEETRYYLNGVAFHHVDQWTFRLVSTDGHRLHMADVVLPDFTGSADDFTYNAASIIPKYAVRVLLDHFRADETPVELTFGADSAPNRDETTAPERCTGRPTRIAVNGMIKGMNAALTSKLIDGKFPEYERVIPNGDALQAMLPIADLRRAIAAVATAWGSSARESRYVAMKLTFVDGGAKVSAAFADQGVDSCYRFACDHSIAPGSFIGFRPGYVLDVLTALGGDVAVLSLLTMDRRTIDAAAPTSWRNPEDPTFHAVLMPMRVQ